MNFDLTPEQLALQDAVDRFCEGELDAGRLLGIVDSEEGFDVALWRGLAGIGVTGILVPEAYGGVGLGMLEAAVVAECLGWHAAPGPFLGHTLATMAIAEGGSRDQQERWLPALASGELLGTIAFGEADNLWEIDRWALAGGDTVSGGKYNVLYPDQADLVVTGAAGGELMLVTRSRDNQAVTSLPCLDATRRVAHISFDGSAAAPLGVAAGRVRDAGLVLLAADAFGGARRCLDMAVNHAMNREQFGRQIGCFQALKHQLADMAVEIEPARGLYWYAAHALDAVPEDAERAAAIAKAHITDRFLDVARRAVEAHGGIGYTWEYPLHIWLKRAIFDRAYLGGPSLHRQRSAQLAGWVT